MVVVLVVDWVYVIFFRALNGHLTLVHVVDWVYVIFFRARHCM
jgi:hypothetical protein